MADLISREKLLESFKRDFTPTLWEDKYIVQNIMEAPAVDAVEVVRCKDCKHCFLWKIPFCDAEIGLLPIPHNIETWFCPLGERKEDAVD